MTDIETLDLSCRAYNGLKNAKIHTVEQAMAISDHDLFRIKNVGLKTIKEIRDEIRRYVTAKIQPSPDEWVGGA